MRLAYRTRLLRIAATDLTSADPLSRLPGVAAALADLAGAALEAALALARADLDDHGRGVRLAVIGMGKGGGRELNYVSDVDVIYVAEPVDGVDEAEALAAGVAARGGPGAGVLDAVGRAGAVAGRRRAATRGQGRAAGPHDREPQGVLRALGQDVGVPGAAQGAAAGGRRGARPRVRRDDAAVRVERRDARALRRGLAGDAPARGGPRARRGGRPAAQARGRRPAGRRVHRAAPPAGARARRRVDPQPQHADRARRAGRGRVRRARRTPRSWPSATGSCACWSTGSSSTGCAARTSCRRRSRTCAGSRARSACGPRAPTGCSSAGARRAARSGACTRSCSTGRCCRRPPSCRPRRPASRPEAAKARLAAIGYTRPGGRHAAHRGADRGGVAARVDPAAAAAR